MIIGRDKRVSRLFWRAETEHHRWSIRVHFWLAPCNLWRWNPQPRFAELNVARCLSFCHARLGRPDKPLPHTRVH